MGQNRPVESDAEQDSRTPSIGIFPALILLLLLLIIALLTAQTRSNWLWLLGYAILIVVYPVLVIPWVKDKWRPQVWFLFFLVVFCLLLFSLTQFLLAPALSPLMMNGQDVSYLLGPAVVILALLLGIPVLILSVVLSSRVILGINRWQGAESGDATKYVLSLLTGVQQPWVVVEKGEEQKGEREGWLRKWGGPGMVVVRPGQAVALECNGKIRIVGPGTTRTRRFERVHQIVKLGQLYKPADVEDVLTADGVPLTIQLAVIYRLERKAEVDEAGRTPEDTAVIEGPHPVYVDTVKKALFNVGVAGWEMTATGFCQSTLRDIVGTYTLDQIFSPARQGTPTQGRVVDEIESAILERVRAGTPNMGIKIMSVDIQSIKVPEEVRQRMFDAWSAIWRNRAALDELEVKRAAGELDLSLFGNKEEIRTNSQRVQYQNLLDVIVESGLEPGSSSYDAFLRLVERLAREMAADSASALRYADALHTLFSNPEAKVTVVSPYIQPPPTTKE
jgi:regulator of protease activity HflC (stomatin/prohibitin superfamily)